MTYPCSLCKMHINDYDLKCNQFKEKKYDHKEIDRNKDLKSLYKEIVSGSSFVKNIPECHEYSMEKFQFTVINCADLPIKVGCRGLLEIDTHRYLSDNKDVLVCYLDYKPFITTNVLCIAEKMSDGNKIQKTLLVKDKLGYWADWNLYYGPRVLEAAPELKKRIATAFVGTYDANSCFSSIPREVFNIITNFVDSLLKHVEIEYSSSEEIEYSCPDDEEYLI